MSVSRPYAPTDYTVPGGPGIDLRGDLYRVDVERGVADVRGVVVIRTPYDASAHAAIGLSWTRRGFHCLIQDVRGRYRSTGQWEPYENEANDGAATLDAIVADDTLAGQILLFGASYAAHAAVEAMAARPALAAHAVVLVPALGRYETAYAGGVARYRDRIGWWEQHGFGRVSTPGISPGELANRVCQVRRLGPVDAAKQWGWEQSQLAQWHRLWHADPLDFATRYAPCQASALLVISGMDDFFDAEARRLADGWPGLVTLRTGPWGHGLVAGITDPETARQAQRCGTPGQFIDEWLFGQFDGVREV